jgi:hypothetical protein
MSLPDDRVVRHCAQSFDLALYTLKQKLEIDPVKKQSENEVFQNGLEAGYARAPNTSNPSPPGTRRHDAWERMVEWNKSRLR